jgi:threonine dehydrogenase-like Zn-dependent dehydrogenase
MKRAADTESDRERTTAAPHMRALRYDGTEPHLATNHPRPQPQQAEALVRTRKAAVSAIDLELCRGMLEFNGTLGHEFVGVVDSVNGGQFGDLVGKRVVGSLAAVCGQCDMCVTGLSTHCRHKTVLGMQGRDGCLADWFTLPAGNLVPVPDSVDDDHAVFAESLASAIQSARQLTIEGKPYITVLGDGPLGLLMVQVMAKLNASVRLIGRYSEKLALCEKWRIKHRHMDDIGRRADQDIVVDCTGAPSGLDLALQLVRPRGTIVLKSMYAREAGVSSDLERPPIVMKEVTLLGSRSGPISEALAMIAHDAVDVVSLIGKRMTLNDGAAVLQAAARPAMLKVLVDV